MATTTRTLHPELFGGQCRICREFIENWWYAEDRKFCFKCTSDSEELERSIEPLSDEELVELHRLLPKKWS